MNASLHVMNEDDTSSREGSKREYVTMNVNRLDVSNQRLLLITTFLFAFFVVAEIIGATASGSLSLLGDAAAMSIDVFSYFGNMWAERVKDKYGRLDKTTKFMIEVAIPLFSVCALVSVTAWICSDAVAVIKNPPSDDDSVNVYFLYGFATANMLIDVISSYLFYLRRKDVFLENKPVMSISLVQALVESETLDEVRESKTNLNMMSAMTHVGGDTFRTASVFAAAIIATVTEVSIDLCDAWAALAVSFSIIIMVIPLCIEIYKTAFKAESD